MYIRSRIVVLQTIRYSDEALIADCVSETEGRVTFMVRISHSSRAAVRHTLFQPLAVLEVEWRASAHADRIVHPRSAVVALPLTTLHFDPIKSALAFFVAEFLNKALRNERVEVGLFEYIVNAIAWLDTAEEGYANFHIVCLLRLTLLLGVAPKSDTYREGACFDLREGVFVTTLPLHDDWMPAADSRLLYELLQVNLVTMSQCVLTRQTRNAMLNHILLYYRIHLTGFPTLKSVNVLTTLFD